MARNAFTHKLKPLKLDLLGRRRLNLSLEIHKHVIMPLIRLTYMHLLIAPSGDDLVRMHQVTVQ